MISIATHASGSTGNCYQITDGANVLMIECGISFRKIRQAFDFQLSGISGCLISHSHKDHCKAAVDMTKAGVDVWMSETTQAEIPGLSGHRVKNFKGKEQFKVGAFTVLPFPLQHDVENHGFLIQSATGKILYITDTYYSRFAFKGVTHFMLECNYSDDLLDENIENGTIHPSHRNRIKKSHFSLENVKAFIRVNDLSQCREIHLIHISGDNGDPGFFVEEIQKLTGIPVFANN